MANTPPPGERNKLQTLFEKTSFQWFLLMAVFFGTVTVLFVSNDRFSKDVNLYLTFQSPEEQQTSTRVVVTVDFGNGTKRAFEGSVDSPITAGQALTYAGEAGGMAVNIALTGDITEIEKVRNKDGKLWRWYLNGQPKNQPIVDAIVHGGDKILVRYE